jgi:uncharacterized protein YkwD
MRGLVTDGARHGRAWLGRLALALSLAVTLLALAVRGAQAVTLKIVFPDGQPMTYGSACGGSGCIDRGEGLFETDDAGEIELPGQPLTVEYRRDGIALAQAPPGTASGTAPVAGTRVTAVLPHMLVPGAPEVDVVESDLLARINEQRAAQGVAPAQLNHRLAAAADLQAAWLVRSAMTWQQLSLLHVGQYETTLGFRRAEVSFPGPTKGGEVAAVGATAAEALSDWMSSPQHRATLMAPGEQLIGVGRAGAFVVVQTHPPCADCERAGTGARSDEFTPPPALAPASPPSALTSATTASSAVSATAAPACGREVLSVRRLADRRRRVRVRIHMQCLRPGSSYALLVRQNATGRVLATRRVARAGSVTLRLRPTRRARSLRVKLKRDGRAIVARSLSLRRR